MPGGDRTGPLGMGPMSGRGAGFCSGSRTADYLNMCGFGRGRGFRRIFQATGQPGWMRHGYPATQAMSEVSFDEKSFLTRQKEVLQEQLKHLEKQLANYGEESEL